MKLETIILEGSYARLEPLNSRHLNDLAEVGFDPELWRWIPSAVSSVAEMSAYIETALDELSKGVSLPFATVNRDSGKAIGSTRFGNINLPNKRVEIGWTWIGREWQRTAINTEAKLLMLSHAFDVWQCNRVEFKTDALNERSRAAIARLGAKQEGIFRQHMVCDSGRIRDTVYFSIVDSEWPYVRQRLAEKLAKYG
jgi:RimJ/RimL family protein N-acetyltransferase